MRKVSFMLGIVLLLVLVCGAAGWLALPVRASQKIAVNGGCAGVLGGYGSRPGVYDPQGEWRYGFLPVPRDGAE